MTISNDEASCPISFPKPFFILMILSETHDGCLAACVQASGWIGGSQS